MEELTLIQHKIYKYLKDNSKGYAPSIREICRAVGLKSTSSVHMHLKTLEQKGLIERSPNKNRAIEVTTNQRFTQVPIIGQVRAGKPILAMENIEGSFPIPDDYMHGDNCFMLRVQGDSMQDAGIFHRDLILVRQQPSANNGDIVVAMLEESVTVKRYFLEKDHIRLQPENEAYEPIISKDVTVLGKVIGLYRRF